MTITEYRKKHGLTVEELAVRAGLQRSTLAMIEAAGRCQLLNAQKIVRATGGEVSYEDILSAGEPTSNET